MALFELTINGLAPIAQTTFAALGMRERSDIQPAVRIHIALSHQASRPGDRRGVR